MAKKNILALVVLITIGLILVIKLLPKNKPGVNQTSQTITAEHNDISQVGVIRDVGLLPEEKTPLGLAGYEYQLTDYGSYKEGEIAGYYLVPSYADFAASLGKCVAITGTRNTEWEKQISNNAINGTYTYNRRILNVITIESLPFDRCDPYPVGSSGGDSGFVKIVLTGVIQHASRPSTDIGYDYQIKLNIPFRDEHNASGSVQTVNSLVVVPDNNEVWKKIEDGLGKTVTVTGQQRWGYAESTYLAVEKLEIK